jgi:histidinol dehydrogenase
MMKILSINKNFDNILDKFLLKRKNSIRLNSVSVSNIINDVKKNGDKALLKYEKKFNKNKKLIPTKN